MLEDMDDTRDCISPWRDKARVRARALRRTSTDAERAVWHRLRDRRLAGHTFRRQHPVGPYFADFACVEAGLVIELDGGQHFDPDKAAADARRTAAMNAFGFHVMRFTDREALLQIDAVLTCILEWLTLTPAPLPQAGEGMIHANAGLHSAAPGSPSPACGRGSG
jgi:very-short-patch-repair endonuclease